MKTFTGRLSTSKSLSRFIVSDAGELSLVSLLLLGAAVALVHDRLDFALGMPGHHGLEWMTVLLFARFTSRRTWVAVIVAVGAAGTDLGLAGNLMHTAAKIPLYCASAAMVDVLYMALPRRWRNISAGALIGVLAHCTRIVIMALLAVAGVKFGVFRNGLLFPLTAYAGFGLVGGACGTLLAQAWLRAGPGRRRA